MQSMASPKSPDVTHWRQDTGKGKTDMFSTRYSPGPRPIYARTPDTLYSFGSGVSRARTDPMTERLIAHRATQSARWQIHWRSPALMVFAFFMGIVFALLQHFLYSFLHHRREDDEDKKFRWVLWGRVLAYLSKVAFGGCVVLVFRQRLWRTFRERALTVLSIDQLFGATEDPSLFTNWEAVSNAPVLVVIAMTIWLIPLATIIFSPGALTFGTFLHRESIELAVPTLNFSTESAKDWRYPVKMADNVTKKKSVMYYNTTDKAGTAPGWFDYYDQPSAELVRIALLLAYSNMDHPNARQDARRHACGGRYNCTYEQSFIAPGYQCEDIADDNRLNELNAPFNLSKMAPQGRTAYYAEVNIGDYARPQPGEFQKDNGGVPIGPALPDLGFLKSEPILWVGYSRNSSIPLSADDPLAAAWTHRFDPRIVRCVHMETNYTVKWRFIEPWFNATTSREHLRPIVNTTITSSSHGGATNAPPAPFPAENFISPRVDIALYKKTAAYHAIGAMFRTFLRGHVDMEPPLPGPHYTQVHSDVTKTRLTNSDAEPRPHLAAEIEAFYTDLILSLFSAPEMLVIDSELRTVHRSQLQSSFVYVPLRLWQCYAPVILTTLVILVFGLRTVRQDGTTFSTGFSRILVTTRNTTLDDISRGACLGNDPFPVELMRTRLQFGVLSEGNEMEGYAGGDGYGYQGAGGVQGVGHCAFGVPAEVGPVCRGVAYAGVRRRGVRAGEVGL